MLLTSPVHSWPGDRGRLKNYVYGSAKAGLHAFAQGLRARLFRAGVQVTTLKPGFIDTAMTLGMKTGPLMASLWEDLPERRRAAYAETGTKLESALLGAIGPGDVVMVKASLGTGLGPLVEALKRRFGAETA